MKKTATKIPLAPLRSLILGTLIISPLMLFAADEVSNDGLLAYFPMNDNVEDSSSAVGGAVHHYLVNPGVFQLPNGKFLMVLKGRGKGKDKRHLGPMLHGWALSDSQEGAFTAQTNLLFPTSYSAEDPCVWVQ